MTKRDDAPSAPLEADIPTRFAGDSDAGYLPTLALPAAGVSVPRAVALSEAPLSQLEFGERYGLEARLGEGGMGVIESCIDRQIGRRVAMKLMRPELVGSELRFLREARVQGQLEHPAVVPVYDLGVDPDGAVFFTMKRVRGVTLADILRGLSTDPEKLLPRFSRRKLLTAFSSVCLAVDYAHEHGVIHRDIKPANVMLGDFGEVYLLDWGLARVAGQADPIADPASSPEAAAEAAAAAWTVPGQLLGTPGYMAPEQLALQPDVGVASDVYALGATLFEILTLTPLHPGKSIQELAASTLRGADARASMRAPERDVPPELEELVQRAVELDPEERLASARELHLAIERHLDGERDDELRREQAERHAREAARLAEQAWEERGASQGARRAAMREIGRTLALQPDNPVALDLMVQLLTKPPHELPIEVRHEMESSERHRIQSLARIGAIAYASIGLYLPLILWCGVRSWIWVLALYLPIAACVALCLASWYGKTPAHATVTVVIVLSNLGFLATAAYYGPLVLTPMILAVNTTTFALNSRPLDRLIASVAACVSVVAAIALWLAGVLPGGYTFADGKMSILPGAMDLPELPALVLLGFSAIGGVLTGLVPAGRVRDALAATERQLFVYAWHLRELVPEAVHGRTDPTVPRVIVGQP